MKVDAQLLWRAVKNATLYCKEKTWNGGEARIGTVGEELVVTSSDDFVTVQTRVPTEHDVFPRWVSAKELKALEKDLREKSGMINLMSADIGRDTAVDPEWWQGLDSVFAEVALGHFLGGVETWELNPERLALLNRLEPKGEYPLSFQARPVGDGNDWLWALRYGPCTTGLVVPLNRDNINLPQEVRESSLW